jgi:predicted ArsR family transcriptional regulator
MSTPTTDVAKAAVLADDLRREIYAYIRLAGEPVTREDVAKAAGISWRLAAFHLEKLLEQGLLASHYARPPGRGGPGAGRSAKYYKPSDVQIEISIPDRRYELVGELLVDAINSEKRGESARDAAERVARDRGRLIGRRARTSRKLKRPGSERAIAVMRDVLAEHGYEPHEDEDGVIALRNCPFHSLARQSPDLVCAMNRSFLDGVLRGMGNETVDAVLACKPGDCCVTIRGRSKAKRRRTKKEPSSPR